ncbi:MAG TPA: S1/P1 nuclease [Fimbriimonadaceae bacterium]|nr:S1/P1 nuclease [Fimbriimonadaceae bacterium]
MVLRWTAAAASLLLVTCSYGWGALGHRQIADIAWTQLNHNAKVQIAKILMAGDSVSGRDGDRAFSVPKQEITDSFLEQTVRPAFDEAATWCDDIKGGKSSLFEDRITKDNAASPGVNPDSGGEDVRCKSWHYYDKPIAADPAAHPARDSNAIRAIGLEEKNLEADAKSADPDRTDEVYALYWVEHLIGDLHQPLHCVSSFMLDPKGDAGGNGFRLGAAPGSTRRGGNLHSYWDSGIDHAIAADPKLGKEATVEQVSAAWTADKSYLPSAADVRNLDPMAWVDAGWKLAQSVVYKGVQPEVAPDAKYAATQADVCKRLALLAGFRLAAYLNNVLGSR